MLLVSICSWPSGHRFKLCLSDGATPSFVAWAYMLLANGQFLRCMPIAKANWLCYNDGDIKPEQGSSHYVALRSYWGSTADQQRDGAD